MKAAERYSSLEVERNEYLTRAEEVAQLTIPWFFTNNQNNLSDDGELADPHNSVGARGMRNLSSKIALTLLPTNTPFFKYIVDDEIINELNGKVTRGDIETTLNGVSRIIQQNIEKSNLRAESTEIFMHLLISGNPLFFIAKDTSVTTYALDQFVIQRDRAGKILELIVKEVFSKANLPNLVKDLVKPDDNGKEVKDVEVYTVVKLDSRSGKYNSHQEVDGEVIEDSKSEFPKGILPWIAPRIIKVAGEHYGRSYGEEYLGDLRALEGLSKSLLDMAAAASRAIVLVNPAAVTDLDDLNGAANGSFVPGQAKDFEPLTINMSADFSVVKSQAIDIENRLAQVFLLVSSIQRDAERVTAEEIRIMAEELNNALGGLFSVLASEFQMPLITTYQWRLKKSGKIKLPEDVEISIVTGIEALGRGQDLGRLNNAITQMTALQQAGINVMNLINANELVTRIFAGNGIDMTGLVKTEEQQAAEAQAAQVQAQQAAATDSMLNGNLGKTMGSIIEKGATENIENSPPGES